VFRICVHTKCGQTDRRTESNPIVPYGFTGRGLITDTGLHSKLRCVICVFLDLCANSFVLLRNISIVNTSVVIIIIQITVDYVYLYYKIHDIISGIYIKIHV